MLRICSMWLPNSTSSARESILATVAAVAQLRSSLTEARAPERCASKTSIRELISSERETRCSRIDLSLVLLRELLRVSQQMNSIKGRSKKALCSITRKVSISMSLSLRL